MASFFEMPSISPTMEVGELIEWRLGEGASFEPQTVLAEVGTDKANMEAEVFDSGVLIKHLLAEGDAVPPGFPMAIIGESADEDVSELVAKFESMKKELDEEGATSEAEPEPPASDEAPEEPEEPEEDEPKRPAPKPEPAAEPGEIAREWMGRELPAAIMDPPGDIRAATPRRRVFASPLARKLADDRGVEITRLRGSGPGGRIVAADVENAQVQGGRVLPPVPDDEQVRNKPMRRTIARRLLESHRNIPFFFLTVDFAMDNMVALRTQLKDAEIKVSYNDLVLAAVGRALREFPKANASWGEKAITRHGNVDVGMAVALDDGLITPVIRDADRKRVEDIAAESRDLATRAREGKLSEDEYTGGTFTVSNLGMMGIEQFTAIINPPEAGILAVGALQEVPVVEGGELTVQWRMKATMTCDHRVIDGYVGSQFLQVVRRYIENPVLLLM